MSQSGSRVGRPIYQLDARSLPLGRVVYPDLVSDRLESDVGLAVGVAIAGHSHEGRQLTAGLSSSIEGLRA